MAQIIPTMQKMQKLQKLRPQKIYQVEKKTLPDSSLFKLGLKCPFQQSQKTEKMAGCH